MRTVRELVLVGWPVWLAASWSGMVCLRFLLVLLLVLAMGSMLAGRMVCWSCGFLSCKAEAV